MQAGLIGIGRMGRVLARRLSGHMDLMILDRDPEVMAQFQRELGVRLAADLEDLAGTGVVILAVPDPEVINCIKDFNQLQIPLVVINIATNVAQHVLEETAARYVRCIGVKFVGQASEMAQGFDPVIIVNDRPAELVELAKTIFGPVGRVVVGKADTVSVVNTLAGERALEAAVYIEEGLRRQGITNPEIVRGAIGQVAAGILKAYADQDLGPFARQLVRAIRAKMSQQP